MRSDVTQASIAVHLEDPHEHFPIRHRYRDGRAGFCHLGRSLTEAYHLPRSWNPLQVCPGSGMLRWFFNIQFLSLWIAGRRENLGEDSNTPKGKDMRACDVVTGKEGRPWLRECFCPLRATESAGPASFRAAAPAFPLFSKSKVILKPGSISRLTRWPPLLCHFWRDLTLPCFPAVIFHFS
jgi:hypothetical protein